MAVFLDAFGPGGLASVSFYNGVNVQYDHIASGGNLCCIAGLSYSTTDLSILGFDLENNDLTQLNRSVTYEGVEMVSVGVAPWSTQLAWTEVFVLLGMDDSTAPIKAVVEGGEDSVRYLRCETITYTGVDSIGTPVINSGTTTTAAPGMTLTVDTPAAARTAAIFGTRSGLLLPSGSPALSQRYVSNVGIGLFMGDAPGTGATQVLTANRQTPGVWGGIAVPMLAADTVFTGAVNPASIPYIPPKFRRQPRSGGIPRTVFPVNAS